MKIVPIIGIIVSVLYASMCTGAAQEVQGLRYTNIRMGSDEFYYYQMQKSTLTAGITTLFGFLFFLGQFIFGLIKTKTITSKVISIIGICFAGLFIIWDIIMLSNPAGISFDEVGLFWILFFMTALIFSILALIQSIFFKGNFNYGKTNETVIDDLEF